MKKFIYTFSILLAALTVKANHMSSELVLDVHGQTLFTVALDDRFYNHPDYRYRISDIIPGNHFLQVQTGGFYPYPVHTLFSGYINIPAASIVTARIDRMGRYRVINIVPKYMTPVVYQAPVPAPCQFAMSNYDFDMLRNSVESKSFESTRMQIVKQVLSERLISTRQVMELMNLMWFESSKLELAKFAFGRTLDKENYFRVNDAFTFESSITELNEFLRHG
ncbi:MAG: DUF4476 domain-containing protein [Bacteroidia bacterium]